MTEADFCHETQITIVGLGLMGGSLAAALRTMNVCRKVVGVARRQTTLVNARALRFIDEGTTRLDEGVAEADLVVLATPVRDILNKLESIGPMVKPGCVVMDVGSTKSAICAAMDRMPDHVQPIGGHPMCGKESSGLTMAEPDLYQDRVFVLAPLERTAPEALQLAREMVAGIGARELILEPERHDHIVAAISHLPYMMAVTLVNAAGAQAQEDPLTWDLAAGGFRDTSRVAAGSLPMMLDILATNRGPILEMLRQAQGELAQLIEMLEAGDLEGIESLLAKAREQRREVYS
jgi:prephenate dehydrogenase